MKRLLWPGIGLLLAVLLTGCNQVKPIPDNLKSLQGVVVRDEGQIWFQPCYARKWWRLKDSTAGLELNSLHSRFAGVTTQPVYMELDIVPDLEEQAGLAVHQIRIAGGSEATCYFTLSGLEFRAASTSPYWVADINPSRVIVKSANPIGQYSFSVSRVSSETAGIEYLQTGDTKNPFAIQLTEKPCIDPENGILLAFKAKMKLFGKNYDGCARSGKPEYEQSLPVAGYYRLEDNSLPASNSILMRLIESGRADLVQRRTGMPTRILRGRWQYLDSGKLILTMKDHRGKGSLLMFRRQPSGAMVLESKNTEWVASGSQLRYWLPQDLPGGQLYRTQKPEPALIDTADREHATTTEGLKKVTGALGFEVVPALENQIVPEVRVDE